MKIVTDRIHDDELCWGLQEVNRLEPQKDGSTQWRRIQCIYVLRGDSIAEYTTDMGPSTMFPVPEMKLLTTAGPNDTPEDRVGHVRDEAERSRFDNFERQLRAEVIGSSTLVKDFLQEKEENWQRIYNRSHFGPKHTKQRNGYDRRAAYN